MWSEVPQSGALRQPVVYSFITEKYLTTPFLILFFMGYSCMGTMSLFQTPLRRLVNALPALVRSRAVEHAT